MKAKPAGVIIVVVLALAMIAGAKTSTSGLHSSVSVWGDSLTTQAQSALEDRGVRVHAKGGTAPCDWMNSYPSDLAKDKPSTVLLAFVGNHGSPCMTDPTTAAALAASYRSTLSNMAIRAIQAGARVIFVIPPYVSPTRSPMLALYGAPQIGEMECALAASLGSGASCDAGARDALASHGTYAATLNGQKVRADDGLHLTPAGGKLYATGMLSGIPG